MSDDYQGTITKLLAELRQGDEHQRRKSLDRLWTAYIDRLFAEARMTLTSAAIKVSSEESALLSALGSLKKRVDEGDLEHVCSDDCLWRYLLEIVHRKLQSRNSKGEQSELWNQYISPIEQIATREPTGQVVELLRYFLDSLLPSVKEVVLMKLNSNSDVEIAQRLDITPVSVKRKIAIAKECWVNLRI
jgi:hypothetical protein